MTIDNTLIVVHFMTLCLSVTDTVYWCRFRF